MSHEEAPKGETSAVASPMNLAAVRARMIAKPLAELRNLFDRIEAYADPAVWIHRLSRDEITAQWHAANAKSQASEATATSLPLLGVPFAIKDNIDVAGLPTTAGCPDFRYIATETATAVQRLLDAGAILIGKTNLDQFATGLVGTRSPYGACRNAFDPRYISGGSSSGSAIAVAAGLVSFALGTDTAGSGRIPAGFNNIVGLKPTRGLISAAGVVPACRSLDCVSIFALTCDDAACVLHIAAGHDERDPYSRAAPLHADGAQAPRAFHFGVPRKHLQFFGNDEYASQYEAAIARMTTLGGTPVSIDYEPFAMAAALLYGGPWVAERYAAIADFIQARPDSLLPVTRNIIEKATKITAVQTFSAMYELAAIRVNADRIWRDIDLLLLPTAGTIYTHDEVAAAPVQLNTNLGCYTNFVNLLDCSALAVPSGMTGAGLPFGVTLIAPAWRDAMLAQLGSRYHRATQLPMGATAAALPAGDEESSLSPQATSPPPAPPGFIRIAVLGAHLTGQPLNWQLTDRGGMLARTCRTAPIYRFYALANSKPPKPGIIRVVECEAGGVGGAGGAIEVELWDLPIESMGSFVQGIPAPLGIGTLILEDGSSVKGFICEPAGIIGALDITHLGGWRAYLRSLAT